MASYTPDASTVVGNSFGATTAGDTPTVITPNIGGDSIALVGRYVRLRFATTGTASVITLDSVRPSDQGGDNNITVSPGATGVRRVTIDASQDRFKQVSGNVGYLNLTYTSVVGLTVEVDYIN
jgi:hypothetical protein